MRSSPSFRTHGTSCFAIGLVVGVLVSAQLAAALEQGMYRIETVETTNGVAGPPDVIALL